MDAVAHRSAGPLSDAESRGRSILPLLILAAGVAPSVVVRLPLGLGLALAGLALLDLVPRAWPRVGSTAVAALLCYAYAGSAPSPAREWLLLCAAVAFVLGILRLPARATALLLSFSLVAVLTLVTVVLMRDHWTREADQVLALGGALLAGGAGFVSTRGLTGARTRGGLIVVLVALSVWGPTGAPVVRRVLRLDAGSLVPGWEAAYAEVQEHGCDSLPAAHELDRLRVAGFRDAGFAHAGSSLLANADPDSLRLLCPRSGGDLGLRERCPRQVALGESACAAVYGWPEEQSKALLAAHQEPALMRLGADLLLEAGQVEAAVAAYGEAFAAGDPSAIRDAVRGLLDRGFAQEARRVGADHVATDGRIALWLGQASSPAQAVLTWNESLGFATTEPAERLGVRVLAAPGVTRPVFDRALGRWVLSSSSRHLDRYALSMPLPPAARVPATLSLRLRVGLNGAVVFEDDKGQAVVYSCSGATDSPGVKQRPLPAAACAGGWVDTVLQPGRELSSALMRFSIAGEAFVADVRLDESRAAETEVTP